MVGTPSSQPGQCGEYLRYWFQQLGDGGSFVTLDELANANGHDKVAALDGGVEPRGRGVVPSASWPDTEVCRSGHGHLLEALLLGLGLVLDPASVLHGDDLALGGLRTVALADDGLGDTHGSEFVWNEG